MASSILMSETHFFPEWIKRVLEDSASEGLLANMKILQDEGRNAVWETCSWLGCEERGIPGLACRLAERYLYNTIKKLQNHDDYETRLQEFLGSLHTRLPILIACCVSLAHKKDNNTTLLSSKKIQITLLCKGIQYTLQDIIATEFNIFKTLDFRIPLWSSVETGELLAAILNLPSHIMLKVPVFVDVADYKRHKIDRKIRWECDMQQPTTTLGVLTLHLAAGAVAVTARYYAYPDINKHVIPRLASLTEASVPYITKIYNAICSETILELRHRLNRMLNKK